MHQASTDLPAETVAYSVPSETGCRVCEVLGPAKTLLNLPHVYGSLTAPTAHNLGKA